MELEHFLIVVFLVLGSLLGYLVYWDPEQVEAREKAWRIRLMQDTRRAYLLSRVADHVTDALDDDLWKERITHKERKEMFDFFAKELGLRDLAPRNGKRSLKILKDEIKQRLNSTKFYFDKNGNRINIVNLPG